jgi:hypothetical protein
MSEPSVSRARLENISIFIKIDRALTGTKPARSINRSAAKYPSLPGVEGARIDSRATPARGSPPKRVTRNCSKRLPCLSSPKPRYQRTSHTRARLGAELQQLYADGKFSEILALVKACLPKDEAGNFIAEQEKSDVVHDLLAFLAEKMLEMNKQKQHEIKDFLSWLEGEVGTKIDDLSPKTKIQRYYDSDFDDFYAVLKKNKNRLSINPLQPRKVRATER